MLVEKCGPAQTGYKPGRGVRPPDLLGVRLSTTLTTMGAGFAAPRTPHPVVRIQIVQIPCHGVELALAGRCLGERLGQACGVVANTTAARCDLCSACRDQGDGCCVINCWVC